MDPASILRASQLTDSQRILEVERSGVNDLPRSDERSFVLARSNLLPEIRNKQVNLLTNAFQSHFDNTVKILRSSNVKFDIWDLFEEHERCLAGTYNEIMASITHVNNLHDTIVLEDIDNHFSFETATIDCLGSLANSAEDSKLESMFSQSLESGGQLSLYSETRGRIPKHAVLLMEKAFRVKRFLNTKERIAIANKCGISTKQVRTWFTNKRVRSKKLPSSE